MKITICILTYKRLFILKDLLEGLKDLDNENLEIIVVDNNSQDGTKDYVTKNFPTIKYFCTDKNIGVAARNIGLRNANGDIIITIDDDISGLADEDLINLKKYFKNNKRVGALNFKVVDSKSGLICNWVHHREAEVHCDKEFDTYEITEGAVAFRRNVLEKSGLYAEHFFISHEGPDLALRIMDAGYEVKYSSIITVKHAHAEEGRKPWYRYYYDTRNQFYLANRNLPVQNAINYLLRGSLSLMIYSVRDGFLSYWFKGMRDGIKGLKEYSYERAILSKNTMKQVRRIDRYRPSIMYMVRKRLFRKEIRL